MTDPDPTSSLLPHIPATATISFEDAHRPRLPAGDYVITVEQRLAEFDYVAESLADFRVAGPRFALPPTEINSVYPPDGSRGRFDSSLPHIVLQRSTLPWERTAARDGGNHEAPWLALIVIDAADEVVDTLPVSDIRHAASVNAQSPAMRNETSDDPDATVRVVTVPVDHLPAGDDLELTGHVRSVTTAGRTTELAVIVATRIPTPGRRRAAHETGGDAAQGRRHAVHLVSIEGLYDTDAAGTPRLWDGHDAATPVRLISLHSWSFTCQPDDVHGFAEFARNLTAGAAMLRRPADGRGDVPEQSGFASLEHQLRSGRTVRSWFHGPLLPAAPPGPGIELPVRTADELLLFDHTTGMLDVSYAAAWELGRTLALQNENVATNLHQWKRWEVHDARRRAEQAELEHIAHLHPAPSAAVEFTGRSWFTRQLARLEGVPFRYLVPDEDALPNESFRLFSVDRRWIEVLMDGAFSIGRTSAAELERDRERYGRETPVLPPVSTMGGFLLRSELVSGYPGLMVEAFESRPSADANGHVDLATAPNRLDHIRIDHLAPNVLFGLFDGWVDTVALHLHPQVLHFGFETGTVSPGPVSLREHATGHEHAGQFAADIVAKAPLALFTRGVQ